MESQKSNACDNESVKLDVFHRQFWFINKYHGDPQNNNELF